MEIVSAKFNQRMQSNVDSMHRIITHLKIYSIPHFTIGEKQFLSVKTLTGMVLMKT